MLISGSATSVSWIVREPEAVLGAGAVELGEAARAVRRRIVVVVPLPMALTVFVMEAGVHASDLADALGEPAPLPPAAARRRSTVGCWAGPRSARPA